MASEMLVRNVRPMNSEPVDLHIRDGTFVAIAPGLDAINTDIEIIDGAGRLVFPGLIDAHAHMDKSLLGLPWVRNEVGPKLQDKIDNERKMRVNQNIDYHKQTSRVARRYIAFGTTHIRTFVDIDTDNKLAGLEGLLETRQDLEGLLDIQIVAFPQSGMLVRPGTVELMEEAMNLGCDLVGGLDPSTIDRDPAGHLDTIFKMAERHDTDIDIHLHEPGMLGAFAIELIAERTKTMGWNGRVTISHAFSLGGIEESYLDELIERLLENDIAIMSHGPSGIGTIPPFEKLCKAGVRMCTGNDGIRDAWGPLNMPDMLMRTFLVSYRNNFRRDDQIEMVLDVATNGNANVIGAKDYGLRKGRAADFVLVDGETHVEAVIERPPRWLVVHNGTVVARQGECVI